MSVLACHHDLVAIRRDRGGAHFAQGGEIDIEPVDSAPGGDQLQRIPFGHDQPTRGMRVEDPAGDSRPDVATPGEENDLALTLNGESPVTVLISNGKRISLSKKPS